ncbi:hypothetical protein CEQ90_04500 [Lewinellaceae bacterium SD302]|nr:hypothetical protein CEQ90_04500 [Lewinellaceae bacterium SD302]
MQWPAINDQHFCYGRVFQALDQYAFPYHTSGAGNDDGKTFGWSHNVIFTALETPTRAIRFYTPGKAISKSTILVDKKQELLSPKQRVYLSEKRKVFYQWLKTASPRPIISDLENNTTLLRLDHDHSVPDFGNIFRQPAPLENYVNQQIAAAKVKYAVGGFKEKRSVYQAEQYLASGPIRDIHLGYDIWGPVETGIYTPLEARIHSFAYDPAEGSYGATIILEHSPLPDLTFYTLYGHLSRASLTGLKKGQTVPAGHALAKFGDREDNGNWPPHLHFQLVLDMLEYRGDFPGVFSEVTLEDGLLLCIDPAVLVRTATMP